MLTEAQLAQYHEDGYVVPDYRLPDETIAAIRADHDRLLANHPEFANYCPNVLAFDLAFLNHARVPEVLDMVEQVLGPDFALWNSSFFAKPALNGLRDAVASGRRVLAHPAARDLHRLDRGWTTRPRRTAACASSAVLTGDGGCSPTAPIRAPISP